MSIFKNFSNIFKNTGHNAPMSYTPSNDRVDTELLKQMTSIELRDAIEGLAQEGVSIYLINDVLATRKLITLAIHDSVQFSLQRYNLETQKEKIQSPRP